MFLCSFWLCCASTHTQNFLYFYACFVVCFRRRQLLLALFFVAFNVLILLYRRYVCYNFASVLYNTAILLIQFVFS